MYILDTNILIYFFKGLGNIEQKLLAESPKDIGLPAIVFYELEVGIKKSQSPQKRMKQLNDFISVVNFLPFTNGLQKLAKKTSFCSNPDGFTDSEAPSLMGWGCQPPFGKAEAKASAEIRAQLEKSGTPIGPYDILIAGTALANQATLVTHNSDEFKRIKNLDVIDWY